MAEQLELDLRRASDREREYQITIASLRAQLEGIKAYAEATTEENRALARRLKELDS